MVLSLRSLMPSDLFLLKHRVGPWGGDYSWKVWCVATCIWMVDGQLLLGEPQAPVVAFKLLKQIPARSLDVLFHIVVSLQNRISRAVGGIEAFCYEDDSRSLWNYCGRKSPVSEKFNGLPGVEQLGSNHVQRMWISYNMHEDERLDELSMWARAKLIASAQAPKGVEKLDKQDRHRWYLEDERRQKIMDTFFYKSLGLLQENPSGSTDQQTVGMQVEGPKSVEELAEEMRKWVAGEDDFHDKVVDGYKKQIIQRQYEEQQARDRQLLMLQRESQLRGEDDGLYELVGYTAEQIQVILQRTDSTRPGIKTLYDDMASRREHITNKYLLGDVTSGVLSADQDGLEVGEPQAVDLNAQIAGRRVNMGPER